MHSWIGIERSVWLVGAAGLLRPALKSAAGLAAKEESMDIRIARPDDIAQLARIHVDTWRSTYAGIVAAATLAALSYEQRAAQWTRTLAITQPGCAVYVAADGGGQVVGFASCGPEREGHPIYTGELYAIYLLSQIQGAGLGRLLVQACARHLQAAGLAALRLWVLAANPNRSFYEALGGQPAGAKMITIGEQELSEVAYGWRDLRPLIAGGRRILDGNVRVPDHQFAD
jgi:GNAT superfamily N-acetyltransferase